MNDAHIRTTQNYFQQQLDAVEEMIYRLLNSVIFTVEIKGHFSNAYGALCNIKETLQTRIELIVDGEWESDSNYW